ncbi:aminodeoxychorismate/anthranilate synthase component II [Caldicellulosiruptor changbaiensis]|uniref:Aminodeoxychorismate/anthranilate synthase component II n=2 Tax=Caldicellulosiruptor TaxID=44000 RepID=A0A3T0D879_9FIRM|nr:MULTISPECIES: aminodeoxychorismate/anthranilate synthase component II [Caldicellulosiruptor]AZT91159.1 aminodeoxychorismate/anthranilate synthase component II [Caldicellulosiruptor changbaiensis]WAM31232.1 aminodeoxychorismate/anthranilate synthase component II [Caldicellulosiruptor naganoensis]
MVLIIDNFDSFTYNLYNYFLRLGEKTIVKNRDEIDIGYIYSLNPTYIVLSPGPGRPDDDRILFEIIDNFKESKKILGVCLGHQAIGMYFGARLTKAKRPMHGIVDTIDHDGKGIFKGLKNPLNVTRYHSLILERNSIDNTDLVITAKTKDGEVMGIRHKFYKIEGVQFHPESIATKQGLLMIKNFLRG